MTPKPWNPRKDPAVPNRDKMSPTSEVKALLEGNLDEALIADIAEQPEENPPTHPSPDALKPWGNIPLPTTDTWSADVLGKNFEARAIALPPDDEGEVLATAVRYLPSIHSSRGRKVKSRFAAISLHGRNDYFFNAEAAENFKDLGAAFYALDLRKYGRSLRPWQTIGYTDDLAIYDEEIDLMLKLVRQAHPGLPVVLIGHSTGGLIGTLWAWRHPGQLAGLILNSAWLELQSLTAMRPTLHKVVGRLAQIQPRATIIGISKVDTYYRSIRRGWQDSGFPIPGHFGSEDDPALTGWHIFPEWKQPHSYPAPAAWMAAILDGHDLVEHSVHLDTPVLSMASTSSVIEDAWSPSVFNSDIVLDVDLLTARAARLSNEVTIARFPGKHDLLLSDPPVRKNIFKTIARWLDFAIFS